jgi:sugar phosphate isomerase/epimerase
MKICFSTLACPTWTLSQVVDIAVSSGYEGTELRFLEGEDSLWKLPVFRGSALAVAKQMISDGGLTIACVGTSCRFHSPDRSERERWVEEGKRMAELAGALGAPGIRAFGDKIQPGTDRDATRGWIAEGVRQLAEKAKPAGVEVWLETHGDFASSAETMGIIDEAGCPEIGVVWDPANGFTDGREDPHEAANVFGSVLRHVHLRDLDCRAGEWQPVLTGEGKFPLRDILQQLQALRYDRFISFEWEKKWRPELAEPEVAIPHFAKWFRQNSEH